MEDLGLPCIDFDRNRLGNLYRNFLVHMEVMCIIPRREDV